MRDVKYLTPAQDTLSYEAEDGRIVVLDRGSAAFMAAEAAGPAPYVQPPPPPLTVEDYRRAVQSHIDATAQSRGYVDGTSCAGYTASTNPQWSAESSSFVAWRDGVWSQVYAMWANPPSPQPSPEELIVTLPEIEWPQ